MRVGTLVLALLGLANAASLTLGAEPTLAPAPSFADEVQPLLRARCVKCHGPGMRKAKLNMATPRGLARGGENGAVVVPGRPDESPLWERVESDEMPPKEPLAASEKETLLRWIKAGAPGLPAGKPGLPEGADHWAFATLGHPEIPCVQDPTASRNPIDNFILARLEKEGLAFAPEADRATLIRRLSFDLIGLPPTPEAIAAFLDDKSPNAFSQIVDNLLDSPAHGERWGKYWLDAAGYADSNGYFSADSDRQLAWRYRDYVVRAVNADLPFDEFIREQIAGDELSGYKPGADVTYAQVEALTATHYLRNSQDGTGESDGNPDEVRADRFTVLEGTEQILGASLFGLTFQCTRCHDHKFEPLTQKDYYSLQAVLRGAYPVEPWAKPNDRVVIAAPRAELERWEVGNKAIDAEVAGLKKEFQAWSAKHREVGQESFHDTFDTSLAGSWRALSSAGVSPLHLNSAEPPGAIVKEGTLRVIEAGAMSGRRLVTTMNFDWTPPGEGNWIEATFKLVDSRVDGKGTQAERIGYYIAIPPGDAYQSKGNILLDGNPAGRTAVDGGYPGPGSRRLGVIGEEKYTTGRRYGVRVTNLGSDKFRLEHVVDGESEGPSITLNGDDLPDGGFGFEYCCGRSYTVDDVVVSTSDSKIAVEARKKKAEEREAKRKERDRAIAAAEAKRVPNPGRIAWVTDLVDKPPQSHILLRGDYGTLGPKVEPAGPAMLADPDNPFEVKPPYKGAKMTGRRLAFARWLTRAGSRPAALLARVTANRIWQHHFGTGLVSTPENFGYSGAPPSHPELLEFLAGELIRSGWSVKSLHRLIVDSAVYRQASRARNESLSAKADPDVRLLSHYPLRRLDAEALCDAMLAASMELSPTLGGPYIPSLRNAFGEVVVDESGPGSKRRSIYLQQRRTQMVSMLEVFDAPSIVTSCPKRSSATIPLQSLSLMNSEFAALRARGMAKRLEREMASTEARIDRAFQIAAGRPPDREERDAATQFLASQPSQYPKLSAKEVEERTWSDFCQMIMASNAFLYIE